VAGFGGGSGRGHGGAAGGGDTEERAANVGRKENDIVAIPCAAARVGRVANHLGASAADGDALQLSVCEETDVAAVGRPEGIRVAVGIGEHFGFAGIERAEFDPPDPIFGNHGCQVAAVR